MRACDATPAERVAEVLRLYVNDVADGEISARLSIPLRVIRQIVSLLGKARSAPATPAATGGNVQPAARAVRRR